MKKRMLHKTVIDEKILFAISLSGLFRTANETFDIYQTRGTIDIDQSRIDRLAENIYDPLT